MLTGKTNEEKIWNYLKAAGLNDCGAAGLMGNLYAESGHIPTNLQNSYEKKLGYTDATYTEAVDSGKYQSFAIDCAGYGLAQWTFCTRKAELYDFAKSIRKSIGDLEVQLDFLMHELRTGYKKVLSDLQSASTVLAASNAVLLNFERPADMGETVQKKRASFGQVYYDKYASKSGAKAFVPRLTRPEAGNKYYITKAAGGYSDAIKGKPVDGQCNVLSNCVGYAYGRFNEIGGYGCCKYLRPVNAENFIQYANGLPVGNAPKLGACMVWQKGATLTGADGAGHVAIVEQIISETEIVTSESGYGSSSPFWIKRRIKGTGNWGAGSGYKFLGFIYNPAVADNATVAAPAAAPAPVAIVLPYKVGDVVQSLAKMHYTSSGAAAGVSCKPCEAKVTAVAPASKHPYHVVGKSVYGWVDEDDIAGKQSADDSFAVGDRVKMDKAATVYGTMRKFSSWVYATKLYVRGVDGSRIIVSTLKTGAVTGGVDKKYLKKV